MWIHKLLLFSMSVLNSYQGETAELKRLSAEKFLKSNFQITVHPEAGLNIYQVLRKYGYAVETHSVTTEDGYILRMQRIPRGRNENNSDKFKPAVLLMHGLLGSAENWLLMGPNKSLAYMLADAGFDVWLGNNRGNTWSRNHVHLDPDADVERFWDFSFEDCGRYDLPAKIDFIIERTGQKKILYVGHSQGTTQFFVMASLKPQYNDKITLMSALAPAAYMGNMKSPLPRLAVRYIQPLAAEANILNIHELLGYSKTITLVGILACSDGSPFQEICANILFILCGFDPPGLERNRIPVLMSSSPAGIAVKMLTHYAQEINSGYFRQFDYGRTTNLVKYQNTVPPNFNLSAITTPVALYYAQNDFFVAMEDVDRLAGELPNVVKKKMVTYKLFNHLDFIFAKRCDEFINHGLLNHLRKFNNSHNFNTMQNSTFHKEKERNLAG